MKIGKVVKRNRSCPYSNYSLTRDRSNKTATLSAYFASLILGLLFCCGSTNAADISESVFGQIPEDVSFAQTWLEPRAAYDRFIGSDLVKRLREVPFTQQLEAEFWREWEAEGGQLSELRLGLQNPIVKKMLELGLELSNQEMFIIGDKQWSASLYALAELNVGISQAAGEGPERIAQYFDELADNLPEGLRIPTTIIGFRLASKENATIQLDTLESLLRYGLGDDEFAKTLSERLQRTELENGQILSLDLDLSLVDMEQLDTNSQILIARLQEALGERSLKLAIGVIDNVLLIGSSEDDLELESFGEVESSLLNSPHLKDLVEAATDSIYSAAYVSSELRDAVWESQFGGYFERAASQFVVALKMQAEMADDPTSATDVKAWIDDIVADAQWLDAKVAENRPTYGRMVSWANYTDEGIEAHSYDYSEDVLLENAEPLSIISHAGAAPLAIVAWNGAEAAYVGEVVDYLLEKSPEHIQRFIRMAEEDPDELAKALHVLDRAWPLVEEIHAICKEKILPALEGSESLVVFAANWTTQSLPGIPVAASEPLPLPELAIACTLADREMFLNGCNDLFGVFDQTAELVRQIEPMAVPPSYTVPRPDEEALTNGTRYTYEILTKQVPLDGYQPQVIVTEDLIVAGWSSAQCDSMLVDEPFQSSPEWMSPDKPSALQSHIDFAALLETFRPWLIFALEQTGKPLDQPLGKNNGPVPTGNDLLEIWSCLSELGSMHGNIVKEEEAIHSQWSWVKP